MKSSADYHQDMDSNLFEHWFKNQLLPNLPPNSVIVMDNASVHSRLAKKVPRKGMRKAIILEFMSEEQIPIPQPVPTIPKLLEIIHAYNIKKTYVVDQLAESHGYVVERLPPYHCIFNPIENIWGIAKHFLRTRNRNPGDGVGVVELVRESMENITQQTWAKCVEHTIEIEKEYLRGDMELIHPVIIPGDCSNDSDSDSHKENKFHERS